jgi:hypothetical protein
MDKIYEMLLSYSPLTKIYDKNFILCYLHFLLAYIIAVKKF